MERNLRLISAETATTLPNEEGRTVEVTYWLEAQDLEADGNDLEPAVYAFEAVSASRYPEWFLESQQQNPKLVRYPLVVPDEVVEIVGIDNFVRREFLNNEAPDLVNRISQFLVRVSNQ